MATTMRSKGTPGEATKLPGVSLLCAQDLVAFPETV
jgi:hypothetical protein